MALLTQVPDAGAGAAARSRPRRDGKRRRRPGGAARARPAGCWRPAPRRRGQPAPGCARPAAAGRHVRRARRAHRAAGRLARRPATADATALMEDAAHSLRLALEREEAGLAHQEAAALRRSQELQRGFLSRLSHELRTPLTAIRGYASSLMQPDVTWDGDSQQRFLAADRGRVGPARAPGGRPARLLRDRVGNPAPAAGLVRHLPGPRRGRRLPAPGRRRHGRGDL